ncbi:MAG TPA: hypothetical protein VGM26_18870 [Rhizomicrobium sp.]|jgi:hypothetical protein
MDRLVMAAALMLALPAEFAFARCGPVPMPPPLYDHTPMGNFIDERVGHRYVDSECRRLADFSYQPNRLESCVVIWPDGPDIRVIPNDADPGYTDCLIEHEDGHLNGWTYDHPGARYDRMVDSRSRQNE